MNKIILTVLVLVVVAAGFWYWQNRSSSVKDCGFDTGCFAANFKSCTPSRIYGGATEVVSGTPKSCKVTFTTPGTSGQTLTTQTLTMECTVKNTNLFKNEEINGISIYQKGSVCKGSLYDLYVKLFGSVPK